MSEVTYEVTIRVPEEAYDGGVPTAQDVQEAIVDSMDFEWDDVNVERK